MSSLSIIPRVYNEQSSLSYWFLSKIYIVESLKRNYKLKFLRNKIIPSMLNEIKTLAKRLEQLYS